MSETKKCDMCGDEVEKFYLETEMLNACEGCVRYAHESVGMPLKEEDEKNE